MGSIIAADSEASVATGQAVLDVLDTVADAVKLTEPAVVSKKRPASESVRGTRGGKRGRGRGRKVVSIIEEQC
jgi:hypothetical protein